MTRVRVEPRSCSDEGRRKNDASSLSAPQPTYFFYSLIEFHLKRYSQLYQQYFVMVGKGQWGLKLFETAYILPSINSVIIIVVYCDEKSLNEQIKNIVYFPVNVLKFIIIKHNIE